jgi:hypothetical protein
MAARPIWKEDLLTLRAESPVRLEEQPRVTRKSALAAATVAVRQGQADFGSERHSAPIS